MGRASRGGSPARTVRPWSPRRSQCSEQVTVASPPRSTGPVTGTTWRSTPTPTTPIRSLTSASAAASPAPVCSTGFADDRAGHDRHRGGDGRAEVILVVGPAYATASLGADAAPHLRPGMTVMICPGSCVGSLAFKRAAGPGPVRRGDRGRRDEHVAVRRPRHRPGGDPGLPPLRPGSVRGGGSPIGDTPAARDPAAGLAARARRRPRSSRRPCRTATRSSTRR